MPSTTPTYGFRYAAGTDAADLPTITGNLATDIEAKFVSVDASVTRVAPLFARHVVDQTFAANSVTYQDDNALYVSVAANAVYEVHHHLSYNTPSAAGLKYQMTVPAGTTFGIGTWVLNSGTSSTAINGLLGANASVVGLPGSASDLPSDVWVLVIVGGTAGTLRLQVAQSTLNATAPIVRAGSYLIATRVA